MAASTAPGRVPNSAWLALVVLTLINLLNYLDRYVVPAVQESIKHSAINPTDAQLGFLASAFLIVYMLTAPVAGVLGDQSARPRLIAVGVALWSLATAAAGLAQHYPALLAARASVGIGEAAYGTIAPALLADAFPERLRARVFAIFYMAIPVGSALGYVIGGAVDHAHGWRAAFFVAGAPGLVLALLALWIRDPQRGANDPAPAASTSAPVPSAWLGTYESFFSNGPYVRTVLGYAAYTFAIGGIAVWMPSFMERVRGFPHGVASMQLGYVLVGTGFAGTMIGGWVTDYLRRYTKQADLWLSGVTMLAAAPLAYAALRASDHQTFWALLSATELLIFMSTGPINVAIVSEVPPTARAAAMALSIFSIHILGDVPSPPLIGFLSDHGSLEQAVLVIPVAVLVSGAIWTYAAISGPQARRP
ncbi:MAG TPA: MFS transporter [Gemmatimonadaceae bacterium]|jgi:MFS family permease|nr:MFS transporter [Gemmatimonadaceae bacterium]